jgi:prepilin-type N-terminal cleavage/methylation domain-containing protein
MKGIQVRRAFTLVEMLVVITLISVLFAITVPAVLSARESGRATTCKNNLRQIFMGLSNHADRKNDRMCSGNFDWVRDGAVTEVGWVADCVAIGTLPGKMLCPSNESKVSRTYFALFNNTGAGFSSLSNKLGSPEGKYPDGRPKANPCRKLLGEWSGGGGAMAPGADRRDLIFKEIFEPGFNTNFVASWWLVRSGVLLDANGNMTSSNGSGPPSSGDSKPTLERHFTSGPLNRAKLDRSGVASSIVPLLGDAAPSNEFLPEDLGNESSGQRLTQMITGGPVQPATMAPPPPANPGGTEYGVWWAIWNATLQDYRQFGTPHARSAQIVFADGSIRSIVDSNGDDMINNGFPANAVTGFGNDSQEASNYELFSRWQLKID